MSNDQITPVTALPRLAPRKADAHKGDFGRILVIGGSRGMIGAPALAANAALRGGAGLVTFAVPVDVQLTVAGLAVCCTSIPLPQDAEGFVSAEAAEFLRDLGAFSGRFDVVAIGPGMGLPKRRDDAPVAGRLIEAACDAALPVVVDADGLNQIAAEQWWPGRLGRKCVITPHPGEAARLMQTSIRNIQSDRQGWAVRIARRMAGEGDDPSESVCVLKGHQTVVTDGRQVYINDTGNPGMASGGSGDVLTGLVAALLGQGLNVFDSAVLGVYLHGLAGDLAAAAKTQVAMTACDEMDFLPEAFEHYFKHKQLSRD